jgi:hypothetical protein
MSGPRKTCISAGAGITAWRNWKACHVPQSPIIVCAVEQLADTERAMIVQFRPPLNTQGTHAYMVRPRELHDGSDNLRFSLHIPGPLCAQLDRLRAQRLAKTSRHQWVLEAIEQRIQRETENHP